MYPWIGLERIESNGWKWIGRSNETVSITHQIWDDEYSTQTKLNCCLFASFDMFYAFVTSCSNTAPYMCERLSA